jgi:hypothetical protein
MRAQRVDRRNSTRINQSQTVRIRPAEPQYAEEIRPTLNVTKDGLYFATSIGHYFSSMIVYVARDFSPTSAPDQEIEGTVVRVDKLKEGRWGVGIHLDSKDWPKVDARSRLPK